MKTPITRARLQNHFSYSWWKYALLAALAVFGWNIIFTTTAYRPPEEKKIILGVYANGIEDNMMSYMAQVHQEQFPDMEEVAPMYILPDTQYGDMILTTRIVARECDIYVLPKAQFQSYAEQAAFMPLDIAMPELVAELEAADVSLSRGWRSATDMGEKHLYGIPCSELPGAMQMLYIDPTDMYLSVFFETGNDENVLRFTDILVHDLLKEPAEAEPAQ